MLPRLSSPRAVRSIHSELEQRVPDVQWARVRMHVRAVYSARHLMRIKHMRLVQHRILHAHVRLRLCANLQRCYEMQQRRLQPHLICIARSLDSSSSPSPELHAVRSGRCSSSVSVLWGVRLRNLRR